MVCWETAPRAGCRSGRRGGPGSTAQGASRCLSRSWWLSANPGLCGAGEVGDVALGALLSPVVAQLLRMLRTALYLG
jgi:hypothetical protein